MAALVKVVQISRNISSVTKLFTNLSLTSNIKPISNPIFPQREPLVRCTLIHTSCKRNDLMEFFDDPKNWDVKNVKVGRAWRMDELRIKSNEDLHKLWYVLLKERNMLLTMEHAYEREYVVLPNAERIDKVNESMSNLERVVRERNRAYHLLETGETGERPGKLAYNALGYRYFYKMRQYSVPKFMNSKWFKTHMFGYNGYAVRKFLRLFREKLWNIRRRAINRENNRVAVLLRKFPNLDIEALREQYPNADINKVKQSNKAQGHCAPK